ncbi:hypothetical protein [Kitasatospora sp. MMS16-BH015]|uniref:hypothetical protein n=1 Tax=Kitasatospora sp. MMS16-BH015 TaxID=2018025 RepID=UPI00131A582D|nr:hypothetical protein [Kitasatospora sp. MMS16-BH015]
MTARDFPGWDSVVFDFSDVTAKAEAADAAADATLPGQRGGEQGGEGAAVGATGSVGAAGAAGPVAVEQAVAKAGSVLAGRRPPFVAMLAALVLLGGAVSGQFLALLAGWALAYVAPKLGEWTRKLAAFGIPLITMAGSTVWYWGRERGRWGSPLGAGQQLTQVTWSAAPGVLRLAGVLSAVFLVGVAMRRRRSAEGQGQG